MHASAGLHRLFEGGAVGDGLEIEDHDVGVSAFLHAAFMVGVGGREAKAWRVFEGKRLKCKSLGHN